jgi:8-oxo-dGTP pyrophosphatase MutT (NUDIX family)
MFPALSPAVQEELTALSVRFGQPLVHLAELDGPELFDPLNNPDRYGEVCMVVRRPDGRLITAKKTFYPPNGHRLLTGGIHHGEAVLDALLRETQEETGLEVVVRRFLAAVAYHFPGQPEQPVFYTFAFLLDEVGGTLECVDENEYLEYFREITPDELPERAQFLSSLSPVYSPDLNAEWEAWGRFRAVIHCLVFEALFSTH